jgi:hypothetical protein
MTHSITIRLSAIILAIVLAFGPFLSFAFAHGDEDHSTIASIDPKIVQMQKIVSILTQIIELYKQKVALSGVVVSEADHAEGETDELTVWVELHSNMTHAHVQRPGTKEESWLLEDLTYTEEEAIIEAIAEKTGLTLHEIEEVIIFPSGEVDEHGDSIAEHDEDAQEDTAGIHIMNDGTIMWGNGTEVAGATITADGKVKLGNGRIVTPKFDLR